MNRIILIGVVAVMTVLTGILMYRDFTAVKVTPPVPEKQQPIIAPPPVKPSIQPLKALFTDPLTAAEVKKDLISKSISFKGCNHKFSGSDLKFVNICNCVCPDENCMVVDVELSADATYIYKRGLRRSVTHENVHGSVRMHYDRKGNQWILCKVEDIDLTKKNIVR